MFLLIKLIGRTVVKYQRTGYVYHSQGGRKAAVFFCIWHCYSAWRAGASRQEFICQSSRKSVFSWCGLPSVHLCGWLPSLPNFTPALTLQRCSRRSRWAQGVGSVAVGVWAECDVTDAERESVIIPLWLRRGEARVSESRCNPHLCSFHLA